MNAREWILLISGVLCLPIYFVIDTVMDTNIWINIVLFVIAVLCFTFFLISYYRRKQKPRLDVIVSSFLTLLALFFTIGNDFSAQFDYDPCKTFVKMVNPQNDLSFEEINEDQKDINPYYIFALDVSGSTREGKDKCTNHIKDKISYIQDKLDNNTLKFVDEKDEISFYKLLQVRLMHTLLKMDENKKTRKSKYYVVQFDDSVYQIKDTLIVDVCNSIYNNKHHGKYSNFIELFKYLCKIIEDMDIPVKDQFKRADCFIVLLSDCLHDTKQKENIQEIRQIIRDSLYQLQCKNVNLKFFYLDGVKKNKKNGNQVVDVEDVIKSVFPKSPIGLLDDNDELVGSIISPNPISFFYNNSLFEDSLITHIKFGGLKHKKDFYFSLGKYGENDIENVEELKQEYYLRDGTDTLHLSSYPQPIRLDLNDEIEFKIKGYIPAPYKSPDIIIKDVKDKMQYLVPVTFYMKLPITGYLLLAVILPIFALMIYAPLHKDKGLNPKSTHGDNPTPQHPTNSSNSEDLKPHFVNNININIGERKDRNSLHSDRTTEVSYTLNHSDNVASDKKEDNEAQNIVLRN